MKILKLEVGQLPVVKSIGMNLEDLQAEVEGLIELISLDADCVAVCNEECKINGMKPNRRIGTDIICGPFFICRDYGEELGSLTEEQIQKYSLQFAEIQTFTGNEPELEPRFEICDFQF